MESFIVSLLVWSALLLGLLGTVVPFLPGLGLMFSGILLHVWYFGSEDIGIPLLSVLGGVTVLSMLLDSLGSAYGAARFGSSRWGVIGSLAGGVAGLFLFSAPGLLLGVFFGAVLGEAFFAKKDMRQSLHAGWGSVLGFLGSTIIKVILGFAFLLVFIFTVYF